MFRTVVVPLDHTDEAETAVPHAAVIARQAGAQLKLLTVRPSYIDTATVGERLVEVADRHGIDAELAVAGPDDVAATLVETASEPDTLLCLATHARRPVAELVMGSVSEKVVRGSRRPVLLVGPRCGPPPERFASMVVGLDGSELAERILPSVATWVPPLGIVPWLFQVLAAHVPLETGYDDLQESSYVHQIANSLAEQGIKAEWDIGHDRDPAHAIVRFAQERHAPLITLTTHGHSGLGRVALGGVAFQVAHRATCPVLVLRPADDAARRGSRR